MISMFQRNGLVLALGAGVAACGPEIGGEAEAADGVSTGFETTDSASSPSSSGGHESSSTTHGGETSSGGEVPEECEAGTWRGRLYATRIFSPMHVLRDCASQQEFRVEGLGLRPGSCSDLGTFELRGLLCVEADGHPSATLHVDGIVGPCDGTCEDLGVCREPGWDCYDHLQCSLVAQDCPEGEKCVPWANDGGTSFTATACRPVDPEPAGLDEGCSQHDPTLGIDSCDVGLVCWAPARSADARCVEICDPAGSSACDNQQACVGCGQTLPSLGLCLPERAEIPIAQCSG